MTLPDNDCDWEEKDTQTTNNNSTNHQTEEAMSLEIAKQRNIESEETALSLPQITIKKRLPWLLANILLYITAASAISPFQNVISQIPVLAVIMPIISNTSGNVAIQAVSVTLRGLGTGEVTPLDTLKVLRKEILAALGTSIVLGIILGFLSLIWSSSGEHWISLVAGFVMIMNVFIAALLGTLLPMNLKRINLDPALISGPFLTTILDTISFLTFLSLISIVQSSPNIVSQFIQSPNL